MKLPSHGALLNKLIKATVPGQTASVKIKTSVKVKKGKVAAAKKSTGGYKSHG